MRRITHILIICIVAYGCANHHKKVTADDIQEMPDTTSYSMWSDSLVVIDESIAGLRFYYPSTSVVGWEFADEPDTTRELLCFVCAASYTGKSIYQNKAVGAINHSDIAGRHITDGVLYEGYECDNNTGGFVSYGYNVREDGKLWDILDRDSYLEACVSNPLPHSAFTQELLIYQGKRINFIRADRPEYYRALCRRGDNLCVVDGTHKHMLASFVDLLINAGVTDALYLDMGDWKYSWMRKYPVDDERSKAEIIYEKPVGREYYGSNWLFFQYVN